MKRKYWLAVVVLVLGVLAFIVYRQIEQRSARISSQYQTEIIQRGKLVAIVGATGAVHSNQSTTVGWEITGRIGEILVIPGQQVQEGASLAALQRSSLPQNVILAEADLISAKRTLKNLQDSDKARADAELALTRAQIALEDALENRQRKDFARAGSATLDGLKADYVIAQDAVERAEELFAIFEDRSEDDPNRAAALLPLVNARKVRDRALANLNYALGRPDSQEVAEADALVSVAEANLKEAEREWERLKDGVDPEEITAAEARVEAIQVTLDMVSLKAPISGTVTEVNSQVGDRVSPGTITFRIDDLSRLLIDVDIPEVDINRIRIGQRADISFDAVFGKSYNGNVTEVSRVGRDVQGVVNFMITIELDNPDTEVLPGMTAAVNLVVSELDNVLLVPNRAVRFRDGRRIVFKLGENGVLEQVPIQIGASSELYSEITDSTLIEGDLIVLNPPVEFQPGPPNR